MTPIQYYYLAMSVGWVFLTITWTTRGWINIFFKLAMFLAALASCIVFADSVLAAHVRLPL